MKTNTCLLAALVALAVPAMASANDARHGVYGIAGAAAKTSQWKIEGQKDAKKTRPDFNLGAGIRLNDYIALETNYYGIGKGAKLKGVGTRQDRLLSGSALGIIPRGDNWDVYGRAGVGRLQERFKGAKGSGIEGVKYQSTAMQYGLGSQYHFNDSMFARVEWSARRGLKDSKKRGDNRSRTASELQFALGYTF